MRAFVGERIHFELLVFLCSVFGEHSRPHFLSANRKNKERGIEEKVSHVLLLALFLFLGDAVLEELVHGEEAKMSFVDLLLQVVR